MTDLVRLKLTKLEARMFSYMCWDSMLGVDSDRPMLLTKVDYRRLEAELARTNRILSGMHKKVYKAYLKTWKPKAMTPRESGRRDGYMDHHVTRRNFATGDEWREWLAGWREGQAQLKVERKPAEREWPKPEGRRAG